MFLEVDMEELTAGFPCTFSTGRYEHHADPSTSGRACHHDVLKPGMHEPIPKHVRESNETFVISSRDPAEAVAYRQLPPIPLRLVKHTGLERLGVKFIDFRVGERARQWKTI